MTKSIEKFFQLMRQDRKQLHIPIILIKNGIGRPIIIAALNVFLNILEKIWLMIFSSNQLLCLADSKVYGQKVVIITIN